MKKKTLIYIVLSVLLTSIPFTSCDEYLDVNENPNYPTDANLESLLPAAGASTVAQWGLNGQLIGDLWCQYVTQGNSTNQYNTTVNYSLNQDSYNAFWTNAYANTLKDLKIMIPLAEKEGAWNYWLIGKVLTAYNFHLLTDLYGDIPFTEALDISNYPAPKYDDSKTVVYPGIIALLDEAIAKAAQAKGPGNPLIGPKDFFFGGDIDNWVAFAKSLKLKIYMRDFEANKAKIEALINAGGLFNGDCVFVKFEDATNKGNPLYEYNIRQLNTKENIRACHTFLEFLLATNDPRIEKIYELTATAKEALAEGEELTYREMYGGLPCGTKPSTTEGAADAVPIVNSSRYKQAFSDSVFLMNAAESYFQIAEAQARLGKVSEAKTAYDNGVRKAFARWGYDATDFIKAGGPYAFDSSSLDAMMKSILTQKWAAGAKANSWDSWMDRNRTGIPAISDAEKVRESNVTPGLLEGYELGTLVRPGTTVLQPREIPRRLPVPNVSALYNPNAPATKPTQEPLWWQVPNGK
ncbi:SusD/RagB family nutrient-binding outer membrane lipoprotein [Dysgonomonas sp. Marseille-P4677]|uniref:SusD/RagB family nutrient-binding outer membrane lipoprotein n=1 Tax=Dysgonomonas sp. Marseille-P4677 TaxID=2364790 RepID=UPI001912E7F3|nr:SusD/RagB family nutrient-binding outer membrane lipoprotein [Dysgonomonas sp. Marseille-P4677]MBK5721341.1 SusD/RagB family nutrient-binding outer membrane lipoprotein [Dysgonomonas sp. Marseille-P4677]